MGRVILSSKTILDNANDFRFITKQIVEKIENKYKHYPVQFFVNGIFSIELYFKSIYFAKNNEYKKGTHKIDELFLSIPKEDQDYIKSKIANIELLLSEYSDGFEKWRYSHENDLLHGKQEDIIEIMDVLYNYCKQNYNNTIRDLSNNLPTNID